MKLLLLALTFLILSPLYAAAPDGIENIPGLDKAAILSTINKKLFEFEAIVHRNDKNYAPPSKITIESPDWKITSFQVFDFEAPAATIGKLVQVAGHVTFKKIVGDKKEEEYFDFAELFGILASGEKKVFYDNINMSSCDIGRLQSASIVPIYASGAGQPSWVVVNLIETKTSNCPNDLEENQAAKIFIIDGANPLSQVYEKSYEAFHGRVKTQRGNPEKQIGYTAQRTYAEIKAPYLSDASKLDLSFLSHSESSKPQVRKFSLRFDKSNAKFIEIK